MTTSTTNTHLHPNDGWVQVAASATAGFLRLSYFPHHIPVFLAFGSSAPNLYGTSGTGTVTFSSGVPTSGQTVTVGTETYTFQATRSGPFTVAIGATNLVTATNFTAAINSDSMLVSGVDVSGVVTLTSVLARLAGNYAIATNGSHIAVSGAAMTGATDPNSGFRMDRGHEFFECDMSMGNLYARIANTANDKVVVSTWVSPVPIGSANISGNVTVVQPTGSNLHAVIDSGTSVIGHVIVDTAPTTAVTAASLPLPTGAATSALQTTINTTLGTPMQATGGTVGVTNLPSTVDVNAGTVGANTPRFNQAGCSTGTITSVASANADTLILASNLARFGATVFNDSTSQLNLGLGTGTTSATNYSVQINAGGYYEVPYKFNGQIRGWWVTANGNARVTEIS